MEKEKMKELSQEELKEVSGGLATDKLAGGLVKDNLAGGLVTDKLAGGLVTDKLAGGLVTDKLADENLAPARELAEKDSLLKKLASDDDDGRINPR